MRKCDHVRLAEFRKSRSSGINPSVIAAAQPRSSQTACCQDQGLCSRLLLAPQRLDGLREARPRQVELHDAQVGNQRGTHDAAARGACERQQYGYWTGDVQRCMTRGAAEGMAS